MLSPTQAFQVPAKYNGTKGTLAFDGQRLAFSYTSGFISKVQRVPINIPASVITAVAVEGSVFKKLVVRTSQTNVIPRFEFEVNEPHRMANWLSTLVRDVAQAEHKMVREVKEIVREVKIVLVKCSYCGFHAEQGTLSCPSCGGPL